MLRITTQNMCMDLVYFCHLFHAYRKREKLSFPQAEEAHFLHSQCSSGQERCLLVSEVAGSWDQATTLALMLYVVEDSDG